MNRLGRVLIISLIIAVIVVAFGTSFFFWIKRPVTGKGHEVVRNFPFASLKSLDEWDERALVRKETKYVLTNNDGRKCVKAFSEDSASALYVKQRLSHERPIFVSWDWKAEKFPLRRDEETLEEKDEFDFVAQVYVIFDARYFLNSKAIQYVWTEKLPAGTVATSPYTKNVKMLVLESGSANEWKHAERDIQKDYRDLFGEDLGKDVVAVSFMTDSDSTDSSAAAYYGNISIGYLETPEGGMEKDKKTGENELFSFIYKVPFLKKFLNARERGQPSDT